MELSVVIPVLNEADNMQPLLLALGTALQNISHEIILVDDGSTDATRKNILEYGDAHTMLVELRGHYGQSTALAAGIDHARGKYIALLDGDLQNDPADILPMLDLLKREDWDVVAGNRRSRQDGLIFRKIPSRLANSLIRQVTGVNIKDYGCTLKVFRKQIAEDLGLYGELHRFIPVLARLQGARLTEVDVHHRPRIHGKSKYGIGRTFKVVSDLMLMVFFRRYMQKPMHLFGTVGFIFFSLGVLINLYLLILKIAGEDIWGKPLLILGLILLLGGIQLITLGILSEVSMRTYYESQQKKTYHIRKVHFVKNMAGV